MDSPKQVYVDQMGEVYCTCASRFNDCITEVIDDHQFSPEDGVRLGYVRYRVEHRTTRDGRCSLMADVYTRDDGTDEEDIFYLQFDGKEYSLFRGSPSCL